MRGVRGIEGYGVCGCAAERACEGLVGDKGVSCGSLDFSFFGDACGVSQCVGIKSGKG